MKEATSPSGEQVELAHGDQRAVVVGVGGGLRGYWLGDAPVLDGYGLDELCSSGRGQILAPWPNRIQDGSVRVRGRAFQLALDEPERRNAVHGLVRWAQWTVVESGRSSRAALEHRLHPSPGYPFTLDLRVEYSLEEGLTVLVQATNAGPDACPYGVGAHPYIAAGDGLVDELELSVPARTALVSDQRSIPVDRKPVEGTELDFRVPKAIGSVQLDHCFTDLERAAARPRARRARRQSGALGRRELPVRDGLHRRCAPGRLARSVAVEPMTCAPNAFRSGNGLIRLSPVRRIGTWASFPCASPPRVRLARFPGMTDVVSARGIPAERSVASAARTRREGPLRRARRHAGRSRTTAPAQIGYTLKFTGAVAAIVWLPVGVGSPSSTWEA